MMKLILLNYYYCCDFGDNGGNDCKNENDEHVAVLSDYAADLNVSCSEVTSECQTRKTKHLYDFNCSRCVLACYNDYAVLSAIVFYCFYISHIRVTGYRTNRYWCLGRCWK